MLKSSGGKRPGREIEASASALADALDRHGQRYRKVAQVRARRAGQETAVKTVLADGTLETENIAEPGDYIVTGAGGERWVVKPGTFEARYVLKPGRKTVYAARGQAVAVENPYRPPISIMAPWGEAARRGGLHDRRCLRPGHAQARGRALHYRPRGIRPDLQARSRAREESAAHSGKQNRAQFPPLTPPESASAKQLQSWKAPQTAAPAGKKR